MKSPFKGRHFSGEIILFYVRWYCQTALSYQQLSDMLHERGVDANKTAIWRWIQKTEIKAVTSLLSTIMRDAKQTNNFYALLYLNNFMLGQ